MEESIISTIKSISTNSHIIVEFELENIDFSAINQDLFLTNHKISLPKIGNGEKNKILRAVADLSAAYLTFHRLKIHQQYNFQNSQQQQLFDNFEKFRLIIKISKIFKGVKSNLIKLLEDNIDDFIDKNIYLPFLLLKAISIKSNKINHILLICQQTISTQLNAKIDNLLKSIDNQENFAKTAYQIIDFLQKTSSQDHHKKPQPDKKSVKKDTKIKQQEAQGSTEDNKESNKLENSTITPKEQKAKAQKNNKTQIAKSNNFYLKLKKQKSADILEKIKFIPKYQIFTKKYDKIVKASSLANKEELTNLRNQLDIKLKKLKKISNSLASKLKRKLLSKNNISYQHNKEEGIIDPKKISQIVTNPLSGNNYMDIKPDQYQNTVISLLLDNSGSMRGSPIVMSVMASEIIVKVLEPFAIKTEILGFTTSDWRGGKSRKLWEISGKPKNPGRLSDLLHIIYKNADWSFKKSKANLALMLKEGLLKENIDGEALMWAQERLMNRSEKRKILIIISDGTPVDDSTNSNNDHNILSDHLHKIISSVEKHSAIEIAAIGIGHNVSDFYRNSITINNLEELGDVMINKICDLL